MKDQQPRLGMGIILISLATMLFAMGDTVGKHLTMIYAVPLVMALRYAINLGLVVAVFAPRQGRKLLQAHRPVLVLLRGASLTVGSLMLGLALREMPLAETLSIIYLSPFLVMIMAVWLMGETASPVAWIGAVIGFLGVMLIARPSAGLDFWGVIYSVINAVAAATYQLLSRVLTKTETTPALMFHTAWIGLVSFGGMVMIAGTGPMLRGLDWAFVLVLGVLSTAGHFLFTAAYRQAPVSLLAPVNYLHLFWAGVLGWLVFGHIPDKITLIGMAMVALAGAGVALHSHFARVSRPQEVPAPLE
jgi:drug/metabolite transporter (DMT)-like permease